MGRLHELDMGLDDFSSEPGHHVRGGFGTLFAPLLPAR